jgi:hypothetical protein
MADTLHSSISAARSTASLKAGGTLMVTFAD